MGGCGTRTRRHNGSHHADSSGHVIRTSRHSSRASLHAFLRSPLPSSRACLVRRLRGLLVPRASLKLELKVWHNALSGRNAGQLSLFDLLGHFAALVCTLLAGFRALLTMLHFVLGAFSAACITDRCTKAAEVGGMGGVARHVLSGQAANVRAVTAQLDARHHCFDVGLVQASRGAAFAGSDASLACGEAAFVLLGSQRIGGLSGHGGEDG